MKALKVMLILAGTALLLAAGVVGFYTAVEYRPDQVETIAVSGQGVRELIDGDTVRILSFNIGYGCNSAEYDFFMDGGTEGGPKSVEAVEKNIIGVKDTIEHTGADIIFLQEVDTDSKRSFRLDEIGMLKDGFIGNAAYARNFYCVYVPYPFPETIGKVDSGLLTLNRFSIQGANRYRLPTPFRWPVRTCQLKRGLLVERVPLTGSDKELVLVNLHLEAYDDGSGRKAQTEVLTQLLQEEYQKGNYCIAGGDFNQYLPTADPEKYPIVRDENYVPAALEENVLPKDWTWAVDDTTPTARLLNMPYRPEDENTQYYVIDGFILSPNVTLQKVETLDHQYQWSDHNPVLLEAVLDGGASK